MLVRTIVAIALASTGLALAGNAHAWKEVGLKGPGLSRDAQYSGRVLSREELRACVMRRDGLNAAVEQMHEEDVKWTKEAAAIRQLKEEIELAEPMVDRYDPEAVGRYNAMIDEAAKRTAAHHEGMKALGARYYEHKRLRSTFYQQCGARYYEDDLSALEAVR